ncbi:MAG: acyl-CoA thioesterase [Candidatus Omnitrophica bacterium]|nr:acyl-CoA thioesterase [Candidatus Omnitrophota bacterium]
MEKKIYYHDTDAGGVVYYANYLKYLEESRTELLEERGITPHGDFFYAVRECHITYRAPARYGDCIRVEARITKITAAQIHFTQNILDAKTAKLLVEAEVRLVCLTQDFKPTAINEDIRAKLQ